MVTQAHTLDFEELSCGQSADHYPDCPTTLQNMLTRYIARKYDIGEKDVRSNLGINPNLMNPATRHMVKTPYLLILEDEGFYWLTGKEIEEVRGAVLHGEYLNVIEIFDRAEENLSAN